MVNPLNAARNAVVSSNKVSKNLSAARVAINDSNLAMAQISKRLQIRIREADSDFSKSDRASKIFRRTFLLITNILTILNALNALVISCAIAGKSTFVNSNVCLCQYRCDHRWRNQYLAQHFNKTFQGPPGVHSVDSQCVFKQHGQTKKETWKCTTQGHTWDTCGCTRKGSKKSRMYISTCHYYFIVRLQLIMVVIVTILGWLQTHSMLKMSQYSPLKDPVHLQRFCFQLIPQSCQEILTVDAHESKSKWHLHYYKYIAVWMCEVAINCLRSMHYFKDSRYPLPPGLYKYEELVDAFAIGALVLETVGLYVWRMGVEHNFAVRPRLEEIELTIEDQVRYQQRVFGIATERGDEPRQSRKPTREFTKLVQETQTVYGEPLVFDIPTDAPTEENSDPSVTLITRISFVDMMGLATRPPSELPAPLFRIHLLPETGQGSLKVVTPDRVQSSNSCGGYAHYLIPSFLTPRPVYR